MWFLGAMITAPYLLRKGRNRLGRESHLLLQSIITAFAASFTSDTSSPFLQVVIAEDIGRQILTYGHRQADNAQQ